VRVETSKPSSDAGLRGGPAPVQMPCQALPVPKKAFGCTLEDSDLSAAALHAMEARDALTRAFRLLRTDTVLGITAETAGKATTRLLDCINARLGVA
jgi:hypothetical protein